ncbi:hypothetical protein RND71_026397 [Anisodus tanguticus]|uniref:Exostosin GT47 domain-containing protein n=1 Tax=Anisodus tanguticus TaxID=243964 RepID=A0AAE1V2U1_9SOLA|nr:hypothetical protein RND71_026397 [Anisodus tanguticus]
MSLFHEKNMLASRFLSCLIAISVFVLIVSSLCLLQIADNSFIPRSVFRLILVNRTSLYSTSSGESKTPFLPLETSSEEKVKSREIAFQTSSSSNNSGGVGVNKAACDTKQALLRVYMYDLPPEFHFGLLDWKGSGNELWPNVGMQGQVPSYPGGLNLQHSIEYWLTLDLLSSNTANITRPCTAIRVHNSSEANVIFVPFFSSLSYNRHSKPHGKEKFSLNRKLHDRVVEFLRSRDEWKLNGGADHLIVAHHPNSMLVARKKLGSAMFVLADLERTKLKQQILERICTPTFGSIKSNGVREAGRGLASSKFCLNIAADTPSSNHLFDAIASHCVPVIISDDIELPFEDVLDYSKFCVFVHSSDAVRKGYLLNLLRGIKEDQWITKHFEYQYPSQLNDAVDMIWQAIERKLSFIQLKAHRNNRYRSSHLFIKDR